jgi:beta-phosphoglucomutase-like phosphatase (HAD superfamily)
LIEGAVFDVDGVLVDSPHERAWRESLRELMEGDWRDIRERTSWSPEAFTSRVYQRHVSGKPRMSGARAALEHFGVPAVDARAPVYADRKQTMVVRLIDAGEFRAFDDGLRLVADLKAAGVRVAAASSSKNADRYLARIPFAGGRLLDAFDVDVSGRDFARGKPDPEMFLAAAHELGVAPERALVVEDAPAGVEAAKAGAMTALGIARADDAALLERAGADLVVTTLDAVDRDALAEGRLAVNQN